MKKQRVVKTPKDSKQNDKRGRAALWAASVLVALIAGYQAGKPRISYPVESTRGAPYLRVRSLVSETEMAPFGVDYDSEEKPIVVPIYDWRDSIKNGVLAWSSKNPEFISSRLLTPSLFVMIPYDQIENFIDAVKKTDIPYRGPPEPKDQRDRRELPAPAPGGRTTIRPYNGRRIAGRY